jgi:hypothetical protein
MPEPLHPPYPPVNVQPRLLDRWLDINSQNGPLTRCSTYFVLPHFILANTWQGFSQVVMRFVCTSPNSFSIKGFTTPTGLNFALAISWLDNNNVAHRYFLNRGAGEVLYFDTQMYTNQVIPKVFNLEVWNTNNANMQLNNDLVFYTSVLGNQDYRYQADYSLFTNMIAYNKLWEGLTAGAFPLPLTFNANFV